MKIVLTGFEPFGGEGCNPSEKVVEGMVGCQLPGIELITAVLPVDSVMAPHQLWHLLQQAAPDGVLALGQAGRDPFVAVERVALNLMDFRIADNGGHQREDELIRLHGPTAYFATLPTRDIVAALQTNGIPARLSLSAGAFLCNQIMYEILDYVAERGDQIPAGFIHLPLLPEQAVQRASTAPSMPLEMMVQAVCVSLQTMATQVSA